MTKYILVFIGSRSQYSFFYRLSRALIPVGYETIFLTVKPSLFAIAKRDGCKCYLVSNSRSSIVRTELTQTTEVISKKTTMKVAAAFFNAILEKANQLISPYPFSVAFIWNGHSIPSKALATFAQTYALQSLFFELSNIPGKIFVDKAGVNARSSLFDHPEQLDSYEIEGDEYERWRKAYVALMKGQVISQTARKKASVNNFLFPLDSLGTWFDLPAVGEMNLVTKIRQKLLKQKKRIEYDTVDLTRVSYLFFPMQVSDDSQLMFNSDVGLDDALENASRRATELQIDLIIKPHPLEESEKIIRQLNEVKKRKRTYIVNAPTLQLVEHCREVMTINSTVGLEAMILGRPVTFLGRTFYRSFDEARMKKYILRHLINIDYFGSEEVSVDTMKEVMSRI